jgi:hypothetical protein
MAVVERRSTIVKRFSKPRRRKPSKPSQRLRPVIVTRAELAECTCPEHCERDHEQD